MESFWGRFLQKLRRGASLTNGPAGMNNGAIRFWRGLRSNAQLARRVADNRGAVLWLPRRRDLETIGKDLGAYCQRLGDAKRLPAALCVRSAGLGLSGRFRGRYRYRQLGIGGVGLASLAVLSSAGIYFQQETCCDDTCSSQSEPYRSHKSPVLTTSSFYYTGLKLRDTKDCVIFTGNGNPALGKSVAEFLGTKLSKLKVGRFADGEVSVQVGENVRGKHVVLIQSCSPPNVNDSFVELLLIVSALRRSSAKTITVVMPYCPYMRSYEKRRPRTPIASKDTMIMLEASGVDRLVVMDMHAGQMQGFLSPSVPCDNLTAANIGAIYFSENVDKWVASTEENVVDTAKNENVNDIVVVASNAQAVPRAKEFWNVMLKVGKPSARLAMVLRKPVLEDSSRKLATKNNTSIDSNRKKHVDDYEVVGNNNVEGSVAIIVNDILDSAESLCNTAAVLKKNGAKRVFAFATHALLSPGAARRIAESDVDKILVTNTCPIQEEATDKIEWVTIAPLLAEAIRRICDKESLAPLDKPPVSRSVLKD